MKLIIDIDEEVYQYMMGNDLFKSTHENICYKAVQNGTPIPDNATNGDVIKALFKPNCIRRMDDVVTEEYEFDADWWNAPYQKGGKE